MAEDDFTWSKYFYRDYETESQYCEVKIQWYFHRDNIATQGSILDFNQAEELASASL